MNSLLLEAGQFKILFPGGGGRGDSHIKVTG